ncbi:MAG TPA: FMN-binding negative transcriptional regulator [Burkholderiaceae bacterium]|nr:FMN-binding negative transcriptional regulator [Burkholderiaceae bacterium]
MYLPAHFEESRPAVLHELVRTHPLGLLVTQSAAGELAANSIPFVLDVNSADPASGLGLLRGHVARANPLWHEARADTDSLVVFQGPQAYVSPSLYASKAEHGKVVPTWNYVMVQARGRLRAVDDAPWLHAFVTRLTERFEAPRAQPWAVSDAPADFLATMLRAIVGIEIELTALTGKWKVGQNRSAADRAGVARGMAEAGVHFEPRPGDAAPS